MNKAGKVLQPRPEVKAFLDRKFKVFRLMHEHQLQYRAAMKE
jgi:hypothetical protein